MVYDVWFYICLAQVKKTRGSLYDSESGVKKMAVG